jgi:hypothetical protein
MSSENSLSCCGQSGKNVAYAIAILGAFLIVGGLTWIMIKQTSPAPISKAREEERLKNLKELRASTGDQINSYGYADQAKGLVRIPVSKAIDLTLQEWKDPAKGRAVLVDRIEKATKPVSYE